MSTQLGQIEMDIVSGIIIAIIIAMISYIINNWQKGKKQEKKQNILDNRFKEALLSLAEAFDNEIQRLHPKQNIPPITPKIQRLVSNGDNEF